MLVFPSPSTQSALVAPQSTISLFIPLWDIDAILFPIVIAIDGRCDVGGVQQRHPVLPGADAQGGGEDIGQNPQHPLL